MPNEFRMEHGRGVTTILRRQPKRIGRVEHVWRDQSGEIEFDENIDQHPIDVFGLPIFGKFIDATIK